MELVLGVDLGTSYFKLGLFDRGGALRGLGRVALTIDGAERSRAELPAERFWALLRDGVAATLQAAGAEAKDVRAVSYSSQANSFLLLDEADRPLTPILLWSDLRARPVDDAVAALWAREDFLAATGVGLGGPEFALAKFRWLQAHDSAAWAKARRVLSISDYFVYGLTARAAGDQGTAALTALWDLPRRAFWQPALDAAGLSAGQLAQPLPPGTMAGELTGQGGRRLGLAAGTPLAVGSLDHHVAAIGAGAGGMADVSESTGTVLACLCYRDEFTPRAGCILGPGDRGRAYYQLAFDGNGAAGVEWYQKRFAPGLSLAELDRLAEEVPIGCEGLLARPLAWQCKDREGFLGARAAHAHAHYYRAILESTAFSLGRLIAALSSREKVGRGSRRTSGMTRLPAANWPRRIVATGGGAKSRVWRKIKADLLNAEIVTTNCVEPACKGAAMFAAVAAGWFVRLEDVSAAWVAVEEVVAPEAAGCARYAEWRRGTERRLERV